MVNRVFAVFDREGNRLVDATGIGMLFDGVSGCSDSNGDPIGMLRGFCSPRYFWWQLRPRFH